MGLTYRFDRKPRELHPGEPYWLLRVTNLGAPVLTYAVRHPMELKHGGIRGPYVRYARLEHLKRGQHVER